MSTHQVKRHCGIRTDRYKLIHFYYDVDELELYDLDADPQELNNIYNDTAYSTIKTDMHKRLKELRTIYGDSKEHGMALLKEYLEAKNIKEKALKYNKGK